MSRRRSSGNSFDDLNDLVRALDDENLASGREEGLQARPFVGHDRNTSRRRLEQAYAGRKSRDPHMVARYVQGKALACVEFLVSGRR